MKFEDIKPGDWVRFYQNGVLVIGEVAYVARTTLGYWQICTDKGSVGFKDILERRAKAAGQEAQG